MTCMDGWFFCYTVGCVVIGILAMKFERELR